MKKSIPKISLNEISYETFVTQYLLPETPVILTHINTYTKSDITVESIKKLFEDKSKRNIGWYDAPISSAETLIPPLLHSIFNRTDMSLRPLAMRLFMQPNHHKTLYHYDGNSLHGFNLQVKGKKRWKLISPYTPLMSAPLMFVSLVSKTFEPNENIHEYYDFYTQPGEMLFLPRYWIHSVETCEKENINYNWVMTPMFPNELNPLGRRENELLFLRKKIPFINRFLVDDYDEYGGKGTLITENYIKDVGYIRLIKRIFKEIATLPMTLFLMKDIKYMANNFKENNFKV